jgi:hypothetical protein
MVHSSALGGVEMWIDHDGSQLPKHAKLDDMVLVRFKDGEETRAPQEVRHWAGTASNWKWTRWDNPSEIVAYRVVK